MEAQVEEQLRALRIAVEAIYLRLPPEGQAAALNDLKAQMGLASKRVNDPETDDRHDALRTHSAIEAAYGLLRAASR